MNLRKSLYYSYHTRMHMHHILNIRKTISSLYKSIQVFKTRETNLMVFLSQKHAYAHRLTYSHSWGLPNECIRIGIRMHEKIENGLSLFIKKNKWFCNILGVILYSRILRMSNTMHITHGSIYGTLHYHLLTNWWSKFQ